MVKSFWFKAKKYGWGWYPASWQGWTVTAAFIILVLATVENTEYPVQIAHLILLTIVFLKIAHVTGEKPYWRWGK